MTPAAVCRKGTASNCAWLIPKQILIFHSNSIVIPYNYNLITLAWKTPDSGQIS